LSAVDDVFAQLDPAPVVPLRAARPQKEEEPTPRLPAIPFEWAFAIEDNVGELREIVEDCLTAGGASVVYGESNSGKTTLLLDLAFRMPDGLPWLGKRVEKGAVIYVACEGAGSVRRRLNAFRKHHGCDVVAFGLVPCALNLMDPSVELEHLIELVNAKAKEIAVPVQLVIVDTVARAMAGANENASEDMSRLVSAGDRIREETGAHVLWVHHSGKDTAKGARGHSSLRGAVDTEIEVTAEESEKIHKLEITKQRDLPSKGERLQARFLPIELGTNQWGKPVTACVVVPVEEESSHLAAVRRRALNERAEEVVVGGFRRLVEMGLQPTDGKTSPDFLPRQVLEKSLAQGFTKDDLTGAMNRLMTAGRFVRAVVGHYGNRNPKYGLTLLDGSPS
jgi:hypothetical protein